MHRCFSIALSVFLFGCGPPSSGPPDPYAEIISEPVTVDELSAVLALSDVNAAVYGLNEVKKTTLNHDVIDVVVCAYERCEDADPTWDGDVLEHRLVKINMLDVLVQAGYNSYPEVDLPVLREQVLRYVGDTDERVKQRSMFVLSFLADTDDISVIRNVAESSDDLITFRVGIIALRRMDATGAMDAANDLFANADKRRKQSVEDLFDGQ